MLFTVYYCVNVLESYSCLPRQTPCECTRRNPRGRISTYSRLQPGNLGLSQTIWGHFGFNSYLPNIRDGNHGDYEQKSSKVGHLLRQDFVLTESKHFLFFLVLSIMNCELWTVIILMRDERRIPGQARILKLSSHS